MTLTSLAALDLFYIKDFPALDGITVDGRAVDDVLASWGAFESQRIPIVGIVERIWKIIANERWHHFMARRSWAT